MVCPKCQTDVNEKNLFCNNCGTSLAKKVKKEPSTTNVFGIISLIFANIPKVSLAGIIIGIIGIVKGAKCHKKNTTPLALSIVGTVNSFVTFVQIALISSYFIFYYGLYFVLLIIMLIAQPWDAPRYVEKFFM